MENAEVLLFTCPTRLEMLMRSYQYTPAIPTEVSVLSTTQAMFLDDPMCHARRNAPATRARRSVIFPSPLVPSTVKTRTVAHGMNDATNPIPSRRYTRRSRSRFVRCWEFSCAVLPEEAAEQHTLGRIPLTIRSEPPSGSGRLTLRPWIVHPAPTNRSGDPGMSRGSYSGCVRSVNGIAPSQVGHLSETDR